LDEPTVALGERAISELRNLFQEIVDRHYEALWPYVCFLTGGAGESEDILHQAFLIAFDRLAAGKEFRGDVGKWLRGTVRNLVRAWWREKRKLPADIADRLEQIAEDADDALTQLGTAELKVALQHCLGLLPPEDRQLVAKRYERGLRITQIAEQMRRNAATVRVRLFRIRESLRACVESQLSRGMTT
jgi:RNA polymerase sigma-70 factor (ECF subfamily)